MAKIVKDTRQTMDVDKELKKIKNDNSNKEKNNKDKKKTKKKIERSNIKIKSTKKHGKIISFFIDVRNEVSKVKWPSKKDMVKYSIATIVFVIFFALFFYLIDLIIALLKAGV